MTREKRARNLAGAKAAEDVEHQRHLRFLGQPGMAAREHHPQLLVANRRYRKRLVYRWNERPFRLQHADDFGREHLRGTLAPHDVERTVLRDRHQPGRRILWYPTYLPHRQSATERILDDVLGEGQIVDA